MMHSTSNWLQMHARFRPDAEAVFDVDHDRRWTYAELYRDSLLWAGRLQEQGVVAGDVVSLLSHNRGEHFALLFACAELGAVFAPMNWRLAPGEWDWQIEHSRATVVLAEPEFAAKLSCDTLDLAAGPGERLVCDAPGSRLSDPWVLMYTSGTTGRPKGALLTHRQLQWNATNTLLACDLNPQDSTLTFTPLFHTGGLNSLSTPLLHRGGRVVLTQKVDPAQALGLIQSEGITLLMGVPTIFQMLADHPDFPSTDCSTVRDALCGGAPTGAALLKTYLDRKIPLRQGFGMTEVGPNCFSLPPARVQDKLGSVGQPIHHIAMRLVDPDGNDVPAGQDGELLLAGPAVFGGYLDNPEATAKAMVDGPGGPWFRTGDILSRDEEHFYYVRGRSKEMFISGAENVYPAEIEAVLLQCEKVASAAVIGVPDARWGEVGRAFIEPRPGASLAATELRAFLDGKLARYKLPKSYVVQAALPRTASGKIDKQALALLGETQTPT
ncbi:MAG: long-chain fatty acid--CoA ligase [Myxococcota bacterium]|nr:long-chain fatty acid--CoA ligase [Myxococcota bacterium]